jgi:hypothetical protein
VTLLSARAIASLRSLVAFAVLAALVAIASDARAQLGGVGGGRSGQQTPTQSSPVKNNQVGPRAGGASDDDEDPGATPFQRTEPVIAPPADPLAISPEVRARIGTDYMGAPPSPVGELKEPHILPYYEERRGDYRLRMIPPLWIEQTRGLPSASQVPGEPTKEDRQSLFGLFYYQRRSPTRDMDTLFPFFWKVRDDDSHLLVLGPFAHREATFEHDNWLAPLYFEGKRKDGGYLHLPFLLTSATWSEKKSFTYSLLYFRDRKDTDVDWGLAPFVFRGDNGNVDGSRKTYTFVPLLLSYHREREIDSDSLTVVGPVITKTSLKRDVVDVLPLYYHITGNPETGGVRESHTTLFPFFHFGETPERRLLVLPGYLRRVARKGDSISDTLLTPIVSHAETRNGATSLTLFGPVVPLYYRYVDKDIGLSSLMAAPFFFYSHSPESRALLTPLGGRFETYGLSRTYWFPPTLTLNTNVDGWENDLHPLIYLGRSGDDSHTVIAPLFWDFASPDRRTTIAAPLFVRLHDAKEGSIIQVAANTIYLEHRVEGGRDWQVHFAPLFSYGEDPQGYFWNFLFGFAGYQREGSFSRIRALWIPITITGSASQVAAQGGNTGLRF